jgi:hypothetical protein
MIEVTDTEMRAAEIVYERDHGEKLAFDDIPLVERDAILEKIKERVQTIETFVTHDMLIGRLKEGRRIPRRFNVAALGALIIMVAVSLVLLGVLYLLGIH